MKHARLQSFAGETGQVRTTAWLTTFNDLVTLLMVFFVLLFSMGSMDVKRFKNFKNSLQSAMGVFNEGRYASEGLISDRQGHTDAPSGAQSGDRETRKDYQALAGAQGLSAEYTPRGLLLTLNDELLFASGSARLTSEGERMLAEIGTAIKPMQRDIRVEGHTDDRPISTSRYPSNWELSTARAISVIDYFTTRVGISSQRLSAIGYGSVKPRVPNDSEGHRRMNRRVEIILGQTVPMQDGTGSSEGE